MPNFKQGDLICCEVNSVNVYKFLYYEYPSYHYYRYLIVEDIVYGGMLLFKECDSRIASKEEIANTLARKIFRAI